MTVISRIIRTTVGIAFLAMAGLVDGREPAPRADGPLTNAPPFPDRFRGAALDTNFFQGLRAEVIGGRFRVSCPTPRAPEVQIVASAEEPGHWPARDWRTHRMLSNAAGWFIELPVADLRVPIVYFAAARRNEAAVVSPFRLAVPGALGMEEVTHFFWPFVEGFEQDVGGWRSEGANGIELDTLARSGRSSLRVRVPPNRHAVTVSTTRIRGWWMEEHRATGIALWARTRDGAGAASFSLLANAFTTNQVVARRPQAISISNRWSKIQLPLDAFPRLPLGDMDLFTIEFAARPGVELLIDDVHLLGPWGNEF